MAGKDAGWSSIRLLSSSERLLFWHVQPACMLAWCCPGSCQRLLLLLKQICAIMVLLLWWGAGCGGSLVALAFKL
jgi:hypothetical protein